jgi:hypothetical protein
MKLEVGTRYEYQDSSEVFWRFTYEIIGGEQGWWAWVRRPENHDFFCVGKITEPEVIKRLETAPLALTQDDEIDFHLWLNHGGMDKYKPRKTRKKKEIVTE